MLDLERDLQRELFFRRHTGYALAPDGKALFDRLVAMQEAAQTIEGWRAEAVPLPSVDLSLDHWMARYVAANLASLWSPDDPFQLCVKAARTASDLLHRHVSLSVVDKRPDSGNVAVRGGPTIACAVYCADHFNQAVNRNWVSMGRGELDAPWANWASSRSDTWITSWTDNPGILLDLVKAGAGRTVLPCYIGDAEPSLVRVGDIIEALTHRTWIILHDDERKRPEIRMFVDRIANLFDEHSDLFAGKSSTF
jgi:DNA-binding transcriptional LysR family regulator